MRRLIAEVLIVVVAIACTFFGTAIWGRSKVQEHVARSYHVGNPNGIERLVPVKIGGVTQWLHIRGQNAKNPVILYIHGGPGSSLIGSTDVMQRPWEDYFTVVQWDQRQAGKSYYPMKEVGDSMRVERMVADAEEVVQYLRKTLGQDKIVVLGHSWGSVVGMHLVRRHPEWLHAYVGVGQVVNNMENEKIVYQHLWEIAQATDDQAVLAQMRSMAPYPNPENPPKSFIENGGGRYLRAQANRLAGDAVSRHVLVEDSAKIISFSKFMSPLVSWRDLYNDRYGDKIPQFYKTYSLMTEIMAGDLPHQLGNRFDVPIFFFTGSHDWHVARSLTEGWFNDIEAPHKELVWFDESAHAVPTDEPGKFLVELVTRVLPMTKPQRAAFAAGATSRAPD